MTKYISLSNLEKYDDKIKSYIAEKVGAIPTLKRIEVDVLPTEDIDENTIYLVKKPDAGEEDNTHIEYMYINGKWEIIGDTKTDLSEYAKKTDLNSKQDTLTPGDNIIIDNNVISAKGYTAGDNVEITGNTIAVPHMPVVETIDVTKYSMESPLVYSKLKRGTYVLKRGSMGEDLWVKEYEESTDANIITSVDCKMYVLSDDYESSTSENPFIIYWAIPGAMFTISKSGLDTYNAPYEPILSMVTMIYMEFIHMKVYQN